MSSSMSQTASKENNIMLPLLRRPGKIAPLKKARPVMKDIQNAFTLQATEARRYVIVQGDPYSSCQVHPTFEGGRHHRHGTPVVKQTILPADPIVTRTPHSRPSPAPSMVSTLQEECSGGYAGASIRGHALRRSSSMIVSRSLDSLRSIASHTQLTQVDPTCAKLPYATLSTKSSRNIVETGNQSNIQRSYDDRDALLFLVPSRSLTPPLSPPMPPSSQTSRGYLPKRSGRTFALISTEVNGKRVFTHAVANQRDVCPGECSSPITISAKSVRSPKDGLPEDMRDILRQLDDLASWVKAASLSGECTSPVPTVTSMQHSARPACHSETETECGAEFATEHSAHTSPFNKGKGRVLSTRTTCSESSAPTASIQFSSAQTSGPTNVDRSADCPSEGLIYEPNYDTPEFLVGSSRSPIAYPVHGYSSLPSRPPPPRSQLPSPTNSIPFHCRIAERRSAPYPPSNAPLVSPPLGKASFKAFFQRSRCNTATVSRPGVPLGHVPVEIAFRREKRMRLPWLRI